jgi:flagellar protein FlgJ
MTVSVPSNSVYTDFQGLAQLRQKAAKDAPAALQEVGKHFEAFFIQMMLQSMRQASSGDPLFGGKEGEIYRDLFDKQISMTMSSQGALGLGDMIARQLQQSAELQKAAETSTAQDMGKPSPPSVQAGSNSADAGNKAVYSSPSSFVKDVWPYAQQAAQQLGVDPQVLVAQAALETGWGRGVVRHPDGRSANNLFGIKAGGGWQNETASVNTLEYRDGIAVKERAVFRSYDSLAESFQDYVQFLKNNPRYKEALMHAGDPQQFTGALQDAGYATDPQYAEKINNVLGGETLASALSDLKINDAHPIG